MPALNGYGATGTLTIDSESMNTPAWDIPNLTPLWVMAEVRGQDRAIPGAAGVLAYRRRLTATTHLLPMLITGDVDESGTPYADALEGLEANFVTLWTNVVQPTNTGDGTRSAVLTMPSGATRTADIHVIGLDLVGTPYIACGQDGATAAITEAILEISIPAGRFA